MTRRPLDGSANVHWNTRRPVTELVREDFQARRRAIKAARERDEGAVGPFADAIDDGADATIQAPISVPPAHDGAAREEAVDAAALADVDDSQCRPLHHDLV